MQDWAFWDKIQQLKTINIFRKKSCLARLKGFWTHLLTWDFKTRIFQPETLQNIRDRTLQTLLTFSFRRVLSNNLEFLLTFQTNPDSALKKNCNTQRCFQRSFVLPLFLYITKQSTVVIFVKQSSNTNLEATVFVYPVSQVNHFIVFYA